MLRIYTSHVSGNTNGLSSFPELPSSLGAPTFRMSFIFVSFIFRLLYALLAHGVARAGILLSLISILSNPNAL